jgi:hypothetical protein
MVETGCAVEKKSWGGTSPLTGDREAEEWVPAFAGMTG